MTMNRREFIKRSTQTSAAVLSAAPFLNGMAYSSPNETINVAVVGIRNRGIAHIRSLSELPNVRVSALCDVDERLFTKGIEEVVKNGT